MAVKILYLDDEIWQVGGTVRKVLEREYGYQMVFCQTLDETDQLLRNEPWDLLAVDLMMRANRPLTYPESGFEIIARVRRGEYESSKNGRTLSIICATGVWDMQMDWENGDRISVAEGIRRVGIPSELTVRKPLSAAKLNVAFQYAKCPPT